MSADLNDFIPSLRREVNPPGSELFPNATEVMWLGYMTDAFWEARLDGFMPQWTCDEDGLVEHLTDPDQEFPRYLIGLIVLYGGIRVLRNYILNAGASSKFTAKAGPVEFNTESSAMVLAELLRQLAKRKEDLLDEIQNIPTPTFYFDQYSQRQHIQESYWGEMHEWLVGLVN